MHVSTYLLSSYYPYLIFFLLFKRILSRTHQLQPLIASRILNDANVTQLSEISAQDDFQPIRQSVAGIIHLDNSPHQDSRREYGRIAAGHDSITHFEMSMAWNIIDISLIRLTSIPMQITEVAATMNHTTDVRL